MLQITKTIEEGQTCYSFTSRGVEYGVMTQNGVEFTVFSHRLSLSLMSKTLSYYRTAKELSERSKTFCNFVRLIKP